MYFLVLPLEVVGLTNFCFVCNDRELCGVLLLCIYMCAYMCVYVCEQAQVKMRYNVRLVEVTLLSFFKLFAQK